MKKRAFITGILGMDGSILAESLLSKGYDVFGLVRRQSNQSYHNVEHILDKIVMISGDLGDQSSLCRAIKECDPHEVYHLAAQSFVGKSWAMPEQTANITGLGTLRVLEAIREHNIEIKTYQASSSEQFGRVKETPQNESTPFNPRSPYGVAKCFAHQIAVNYRESYGMHVSCGILFNHEHSRRGKEFVTRKITDGVARLRHDLIDKIKLGNIDAKRDWGYAPDYVEAMWLMLQQEKPDDYVIASGECHSVREFLELAFRRVGIVDWEKYIEIDPSFLRPAEVDILLGDATKAKEKLGWMPKTSFKELVEKMVEHDFDLVERFLKSR